MCVCLYATACECNCASHHLSLLLRAGGGRLTLLWGELWQLLLLLQRVKDERTSGDLETLTQTHTHTYNVQKFDEEQKGRWGGAERRGRWERNDAHVSKEKWTRAEGNRRINKAIKQYRVRGNSAVSSIQTHISSLFQVQQQRCRIRTAAVANKHHVHSTSSLTD